MEAQSTRCPFGGAYTAIVTPFHPTGEIDWKALDRLVDEQIAAKIDGLVPCGTTGESPTLSHEEHREVVRRVVERVARRVPVVAGTGSNSTAEALALTRYAAEVGADGALVVVPYYNKPPAEGLYRHFAALARAVPRLPLVLYNIPGRTGINMLPATMARLATEHESIVAVKEAAGSLDQVSEIVAACGDAFAVLSGDDSLTLPMMAVGAMGVISVASNVVPGDVARLCALFREGRTAEARALHLKLFPLVKALFLESNPTPVKAALAQLGRIPHATVRLPLVEPEEKTREKLRQALAAYGLEPGGATGPVPASPSAPSAAPSFPPSAEPPAPPGFPFPSRGAARACLKRRRPNILLHSVNDEPFAADSRTARS